MQVRKSVFALHPYLSLTKVNEVLQINVFSVVDDGLIDNFSHFIPSLDRVWGGGEKVN